MRRTARDRAALVGAGDVRGRVRHAPAGEIPGRAAEIDRGV
ncbi:hypothetical protein [Streptomyces echinatus]|uniref:Uncharacterized protein n=1 Tax=Streptomyces echinatus TaxID=67293 RepID=A0A7W9Q2Q8_9ACTN|nr:hypothetical protein [Streptomyces echinatus]MBB5932256.1 hypothetical protein [Streptomyces echinatus]